MKVYIEQTILINFIIDFCILTIIAKLLFVNTSKKRLILSALFGSVIVLIYPYCINQFLVNSLKILSALLMLQIMHSMNYKQLSISLLLMLGLSYTIGGTIISNIATTTNSGYTIKPHNTISAIILTILSSVIIYNLIKYIKFKILSNSHIHEINLTHQQNSIIIKGLIDSGNSLNDNLTPVSLINFDTFTRLTNISINDYINRRFSSLINPKFITAKSIGGVRQILVFTIDKLTILNTNKSFSNIRLGVMLNFDNSKEYKAILNNCFCLN